MDNSVQTNNATEKRTVDEAWKYLESHTERASHNANPDELRAIRHKVDWRIVPLMFLCYTMQFLDKVLINYAGVMGIKNDIQLVGNDFSNAATAFFVAYLIAEIPNVYFLQRVPPAKWLGLNVFLWGLVTATTAGVQDFPTLLVARIFLGIFEATIGPSLMLISSQWYTKTEQAPRFAFWYLGLGVGQIVGGIVSFRFQHVASTTFQGWRIMFIVIGLVTMGVGLASGLYVPDTPMQATFLTKEEKVSLLKHVSVNKTGIRNTKFRSPQVLEALLDPQVWLLTLNVILQSVSSGVVTTYSSTLIKNMGFSPKHSALLNTPSGLVSIFFTALVGFGIRKASHRWAWVFMCSIPGIIGGGLMSFLPKDNKAGLLAGIYLINAIVAPLPVIYHWTAANCAGYTKRAFASALIAGSFSVGNIIGPQTFQARDAPEYRPAKIAVLATQAAAAVLATVLFVYYVWENKRRDTKYGKSFPVPEEQGTSQEAWAGLTDRENTQFRYVY